MNYATVYGDPLPEKYPKLLGTYHAFRVIVTDDFKQEFGDELPVVPLIRNIKSKSLKAYANDKVIIKVGELIKYIRYEARLNQYVFTTDDNVEISLSEAFINRKFLFPINLSR